MNTIRSQLFDTQITRILEHTTKERLATISAAWSAKPNLGQEELVAFLSEAMHSPERIQRILDTCTQFERTALALIKSDHFYDEITTIALLAAVAGLPAPKVADTYDNYIPEPLVPLFEKGVLFVVVGGYYVGSTRVSFSTPIEFLANPRVLTAAQAVDTQALRPFDLRAAPVPETTLSRRPQVVALGHSAFLRTLSATGELKVNRTGQRNIAAAAMKGLTKALDKQGWFTAPTVQPPSRSVVEPAIQPVPFPVEIYLNAAMSIGLLQFDEAKSVYKVTALIEDFMQQDFVQLARLWLTGLARTPNWHEDRPSSYSFYGYTLPMRSVLIMALALLGQNRDFTTVKHLSDAIFTRIGESFSLDPHEIRPTADIPRWENTRRQQRSAEELLALLKTWRIKLAQNWQKLELPFIERGLLSWGYGWGLVELGMTGDALSSIRLTDFGQAVLGFGDITDHGQRVATHAPGNGAVQVNKPQPGVWVVQPNFDVLVYLERVTPQQLGFIERYGERTQVDQHTAHYRLTRQSVYEALERGGALDALVSGLSVGSVSPLPQNVLRELQGWAALREQLTLRTLARVAEFPNAEARDAASVHGQRGQPIGDRFLRLEPKGSLQSPAIGVVDYSRPLPDCLTMSEDGLVTLDPAGRDLIIESQLNAWAEHVDRDHWRLTQANVAGAIQKGATLAQFSDTIKSRLKSKMPNLLHLAINNWAGVEHRLEVERVIAVRSQNVEVMQAISRSTMFKKLLRGTIAPNIALVNAAQINEFEAALRWLGIEPKSFGAK